MPRPLTALAIGLAAVLAAPNAHAGKDSTVQIDGDLDSVVIVGDATTAATGFLSDAKTNVGVIDDARIRGSASQTVIVGDVATIASSGFSDAETGIGVVKNSTISGN
ncbi:MAG: hypothetical protein AAFY43_08125, partial [Pseudomonadota bacterium]